jgi:MFS family permease
MSSDLSSSVLRTSGHSLPTRSQVLVLVAATVGMAAAFGAITTISVLMGPFADTFGWERSDVSMGYALIALGAAVGGLGIGKLVDRFPTGPLAMAGAAALGLGLFAVPYQSDLRAIWALYFLMGVAGFSALYSPLLTSVGLWFGRGRGLAIGLATAGGAIGQAAIPPIFEMLAAQAAWREAMTIIGLGYLWALTPLMALVSKPQQAANSSALGRGSAWPISPKVSLTLLGIASVCCCALMAVPTVHIIAALQDAGYPSSSAALVLSTLMLAGVVGRIGAGILADRIGSLPTYGLVSALQTITVYFLLAAEDLGSAHLAAALFGLGFGGVMTALVCAVRDAVPPGLLGRANAFISFLAWTGMALGGLQGGLCFGATGDYSLSFANAVLAGLINLATLGTMALMLRRATLRVSG